MRRRVVLIPLLVLVAAVALTGGLLYRANRDDQVQIEELTQATGADVGPATRQSDRVSTAGDIPQIGEEWLRAVQAAAYELEIEQAHARAREQAAAARVQAQGVAAAAIRTWGAGQLLLAMPSIGVTAAVAGLGFERDGRTPATPDTPWGVGWYTFTDYPGTPGNAVFSGHVDWYTGAPAVFGRLGSVRVGDPIYMVLADGTPIAYQVTQSYWVNPYTANISEIFGITASEAVTFITCGGTWDPVAKDYSHRLVVRAHRVR